LCGSGKQAYLIAPKLFGSKLAKHTGEFLAELKASAWKGADDGPVRWQCSSLDDVEDAVLCLQHQKPVTSFVWHRKGDYFTTLCPLAGKNAIMIHQLSRGHSQSPFSKSLGSIQAVVFHPNKPFFFVATQRHVRVYNLMRQELHKCLLPGVKWISSMDIHPKGDNLIISSYDKKVCWFDMDLSLKPYKILRFEKHAVRHVAFHQKQPLFATCSDDGRAHLFHGKVHSELTENPDIFPIRILNAHEQSQRLGVLSCQWHPTQPWLFTSGADGKIHLYT
jgi:ribosome biogenesis protein ERB1